MWGAVGLAGLASLAVESPIGQAGQHGVTIPLEASRPLGASRSVDEQSVSSVAIETRGARRSSLAGRLIVAALGFAFPVSLLGARRPHEWGWQFVVVTLLAVLAQPAFEASLYGAPLVRIAPVRQGLFGVLLLIGWTNWWGTRFSLVATGWAFVQWEILSPLLAPPSLQLGLPPVDLLVIASLCVLVATIQLVQMPVPTTGAIARECEVATGDDSAQPIVRAWQAYRDMYGVIWALRIIERTNLVLRRGDFPLAMTWRGLRPIAADGDRLRLCTHSEQEAIRHAIVGLLRRFVSLD